MNGRRIGLSVAFAIAILAVTILPRENWWWLMTAFGFAFFTYLLILRDKNARTNWKYWLLFGVGVRFILIFTFPGLSDDIYRFIWDGHVVLEGINPYSSTPAELIASERNIPALDKPLFELLNSQKYHSVYPPLDQAIFAIASWLSGSDQTLAAIILKLFIFAFECITLWLMSRILNGLGRNSDILFYALNPLVIVELTGNIHFEALMILGLVLTYYFLLQRQVAGIALGLITGIGAKLLPVICIPYLLRRMRPRRFALLLLVVTPASLVLLLPMITAGNGPLDSVNLYFQSFEFNASFYYLARWIGYQNIGYNQIALIGPMMAAITIASLSALWLLEKNPTRKNYPHILLWAFTLYLLLSTTVHPWYICPLVAMCVFTRWRFPIAWSGVVFLSYSAYQTTAYVENLWLVAIEYVVLLGYIVYELRREWQARVKV